MPDTVTDTPPVPRLTPSERVARWEPALTQHGWTVRITHTEQRARLEATHPSGAMVMVTSGIAGRNMSGSTRRYVLFPGQGSHAIWYGVHNPGLEEFIRARVVKGRKIRLSTKCRCRTGAGRTKVRYATKKRASKAMAEARARRVLEGEGERAECRTYRCPDDDRAWHTSSRPSWSPAAGESPLWSGEAKSA